MQQLWLEIDGQVEELCLPPDHEEVLPGIRWGCAGELFTPSFWKYQSEAQTGRKRYTEHRLGQNLLEEVAVCLLGGYGIPAEMGLAAFHRLKSLCLLTGHATEEELLSALMQPFRSDGKPRHYRFARQKAAYLAKALAQARLLPTEVDARALRDALLNLPGIGPKTASWVVRNYLDADNVAIVDVHIHRACVMMNLFDEQSDPSRDYFKLEERFLQFAAGIKVRASILDAIIWDIMRRVGPTSRNAKPAPFSAQAELAF